MIITIISHYRVERSRSIIPSMISAINCIALEENEDQVEEPEDGHKKCSKRVSLSKENKAYKIRRERLKKRKNEENIKMKKLKRTLNLEYFYELLFTRKNLKLVHIVCHDKQEHLHKKCDENNMFIYCDIEDNN